MKVTHYHVSGPVDGVCKQSAIWARGSHGEQHAYSPLVYLQRPKWITDDAAWRKIVAAVNFKLPRGTEIK